MVYSYQDKGCLLASLQNNKDIHPPSIPTSWAQYPSNRLFQKILNTCLNSSMEEIAFI